MSAPEIFIATFFRKEWGDVGIKDLPFPGDPIEKTKSATCSALESHFNDPNRQSQEKPHTAQLIGRDDRIVATFQMREVISVGPKAVEV